MKTRVSSYLVLLIPLLIAAGVVFCFSSGALIPVHGNSMMPTLQDGTHIWVNRFAYGIRSPLSGRYMFGIKEPERGDLILYRSPKDNHLVVKRCIGLPGDKLTAVRGDMLIASSILIPMRTGQERTFAGMDVIPTGMIFTYGENSTRSIDSRDYGLVQISSIEGKVIGIIQAGKHP